MCITYVNKFLLQPTTFNNLNHERVYLVVKVVILLVSPLVVLVENLERALWEQDYTLTKVDDYFMDRTMTEGWHK